MTFFMMTPQDVSQYIAKQARSRRLNQNMSQHSLSVRSGVSLGVIKKFERIGKISLESLLKLALTLDALDGFEGLFNLPPPETFQTLDEILQDKTRQRGRK